MTISRLPQLRSDASIVLGAGALLNLLGTGCAPKILVACGRRFLAERGITLRLPKGLATSNDSEELFAGGILRLEALPLASSGILLALSGAPPPDDLGDEEAACIALAYGMNGAAVLDDVKPQRLAANTLESGALHSLDLMSTDAVQEALGRSAIREALDRARRDVRLRIPARFQDWAASLS